MRRPIPPVPPYRYNPCPDGDRCPTMHDIVDSVRPRKGCMLCQSQPWIPPVVVVVELGTRTLHWTCNECECSNRWTWPEDDDHGMHAVVRCGADTLREDRYLGALLRALVTSS